MGKYSLIIVAGFVLAFGYIKNNLNQVSGRFVDNFLARYEQAEARLTANSVANMSLAMLSDSTTWRTGYSNATIGGGTGWAALEDNATDTTLSVGQVRITAGGSSGSTSDTVVVLVSITSSSIPPGVHGGVTANSRVSIQKTMLIDGRDHDLNGVLLSGQGIKGVSTPHDLEQSEDSKVGGTAGGVDYVPSTSPDPAIVEEYADYTPPSTPDEVFGYAEGTLKAMAQSGANGSQYVTDPENLTFPLSGVTYVERPGSDGWENIDFGTSTGVLVVHNSTTESWMKGLNTGTFKGLIIGDDVNLIHATILGAVISLTTNPQGYTIGDGSGEILYSSAALQQASSVAAGGGGGGSEGGEMTVVSWLE